MRGHPLLAALACLAAVPAGAAAQGGRIAAAIERASPGDTVRVPAGVHFEHLRLDRPIVLLGEEGAVIDGEGRGTVIEVTAPGAEVVGLQVRGSGRLLDQEDAGILVTADSCVIAGNELEDVLFGIYLKESDGTTVEDNRIFGKDRPLGMRGDGIRLWYSDDALIERNEVHRTRDVVIYFSEGLRFRENLVTGGRYGLHYMYSSDNLFEDNEFSGNDVAAFIMYSSNIVLRRNVFAEASGRSGYGIGLKDADWIEISDNLIVQNQTGLYLDNSPSRTDARNRIVHNVLAFNDAAVELLPSVRDNDFSANTFTSNARDVMVSGGGSALANDWTGNHWDDAASWDADGDGILDHPYRIERLSDDLLARHPRLRLFESSPATVVLDALGRFFPFLEPRPIVIDSAPRAVPARLEIGPVGRSRGAGPSAAAEGTAGEEGEPAWAVVWLAMAGLSLWGFWRWRL